MSETSEVASELVGEEVPVPPPKSQFPFWVVGIGASAGGLESLERFFAKATVDSGMAYIVVQHLSPDFKSVMDELLARQTEISIRHAHEGLALEPDTIYLIPPRKVAILSGGRFHLTDKEPKEPLSLPIDNFFRSLAADIGPRAVAVVLSGSGRLARHSRRPSSRWFGPLRERRNSEIRRHAHERSRYAGGDSAIHFNQISR
jgi:chemotaxis response regulator CheB